MSPILALMLITRATAEWVEISQHHYRRPIKTHNIFATPDTAIDIEDTTIPYNKPAYNNHSVTEYNWDKNVARTPSVANMKRVHYVGSTVKTTERVKFDDEDVNLDVDVVDIDLPDATKATAEFHQHAKQKGTIERVTNLGNIKRVQLNNSPVKSPAINFKGDREKYSNRNENVPLEDKHHVKATELEQKKSTETHNRRIYVNQMKKYSTDRTATFSPYEDDNTSFGEELTTFNTKALNQEYKNRTTYRYLYSTKPTFITETEDFSDFEIHQNKFYKNNNIKSSEAKNKYNAFNSEAVDIEEDLATRVTVRLTKPTTEKSFKTKVDENSYDFEAESHENKVHVTGDNVNQKYLMRHDHKPKVTDIKDSAKHDHQLDKENVNVINKKSENTSSSAKTEKLKVNTLENVIKFMKVVADTISTNSRRSFSGKLQYLHQLKDSILNNIENRIDTTWPDDDSASARRRSRSAHASPRGHVQIPSSESALMTISFLTFAVFLIKLVLQVIQTYKHKTMMVAPVMVASGRNVFTSHGYH